MFLLGFLAAIHCPKIGDFKKNFIREAFRQKILRDIYWPMSVDFTNNYEGFSLPFKSGFFRRIFEGPLSMSNYKDNFES